MTTDKKSNAAYWPKPLSIYHPNAKGTGAALQLEPRVNRRPNDRANCFFLELASQKTGTGVANGQRVPASFDWENKITVKLGFHDLCEILAVLEGRQDRVGQPRNGLYHDNGSANTIISFQYESDRKGYALGLSRKAADETQSRRIGLLLSEAEAIGIRHILQIGLFFVLFHGHLGRSSDAGQAAESGVAC